MRQFHHRSSTRAGFTLIELLAVLMILAILIAVLVSSLMQGEDAVKAGVARNRLAQLGTALGEHSDEHGEYPPSQLPSDLGTAPDATNVGSECLYLALCAEGAPGYATLGKAEYLCNTDRDALSKRPKGFETQDLLEMADPWGNPIVYIRASDYEREFRYIFVDTETGEENEATLRALKNSTTGRYEEPSSFQLFSAGIDGRFGTADDISNFKK